MNEATKIQDSRTNQGWPFFRNSNQIMGVMGDSFNAYSNIAKKLMDATKPFFTEGNEEMMKTWQNTFTGNQKGISEAISKVVQSFGIPPFKEVTSWKEVFENWQQFVKTSSLTPEMASRGWEELISLCEKWQKGTLNLFDNWNNCMQKLVKEHQASLTRWDNPQQIWKAYISSCEEFNNAFTEAGISFTKEQSKACLLYLKSLTTGEVRAREEEKGEEKKKESKKTRA